MKGSRVQNVVQELRGEKIDIIPWHVDAAKFVCNALAPAEIARVIIDEGNRSMEVIVPDDFLSVAIGKRGQNVRLASKLTGWHLDVNSESQYNETMKTGYESLKQVNGVGPGMADILFEKGFYSAEELADADIDDLVQIKGIGEEKARQLVANAREFLSKKKLAPKQGVIENQRPISSTADQMAVAGQNPKDSVEDAVSDEPVAAKQPTEDEPEAS
jgi:N utilization substance protein A